jgi:hypothetical protein
VQTKAEEAAASGQETAEEIGRYLLVRFQLEEIERTGLIS